MTTTRKSVAHRPPHPLGERDAVPRLERITAQTRAAKGDRRGTKHRRAR